MLRQGPAVLVRQVAHQGVDVLAGLLNWLPPGEMGRELAGQLVSFLAGQPGTYDGRSGRLGILLCHNLMITGRSPSYRDQHAETWLIRIVTPPWVPGTALPGHEVRLPY